MQIILAILQGCILGAGMIIPIGAQNAYILGQGINRNHHVLAASLCIFCDVILILVGVFGAGTLISSYPLLTQLITWAGIVFLLFYGALSFKQFLRNQYEKTHISQSVKSKNTVIATTLAVTLLNPHVYLDTVVVLGSVGSQFEGNQKVAFALGTILASFIWFYGLAIAAARMSSVLSQPRVLRGIDFMVGLIMWFIAFSLFSRIV